MTKKEQEYQNLQGLVQDALLQAKHLKISFDKCSKIDLGRSANEFSEAELESLEALVSRFGRLSDIVTQKIFRLIDELEYVRNQTFIDRINAAEKREIIDSAYDFREIRTTRNEIEHEYVSAGLFNLYSKTLVYTPKLLAACEKLEPYIKNIEI